MAIEIANLEVRMDGGRPMRFEELTRLAATLQEITQREPGDVIGVHEEDMTLRYAPESHRNVFFLRKRKETVIYQEFSWGWIEISRVTLIESGGVSFAAKAVLYSPE